MFASPSPCLSFLTHLDLVSVLCFARLLLGVRQVLCLDLSLAHVVPFPSSALAESVTLPLAPPFA